MGKTGKISTIKKEYNTSSIQTMDSGLAAKGMTRIPGTGVFKYPYKELDGKYRTGLDPDAAYIKRIKDDTERELEIERVTALRKKLEAEIGDIDLGPRSKFWNYGLSTSSDDQTHVQPVKLMDGDNYFDLSNAYFVSKERTMMAYALRAGKKYAGKKFLTIHRVKGIIYPVYEITPI